jgi:hypothetical protein
MAVNRGALGADTFLLPQVQPTAMPQQQPLVDGIQALEGLQDIEGQTSDYYKKVADLKGFMQQVWTNFGIDVRVPDFARPESIKLNQVYQKAIADILAHGNQLKESSKLYAMRDQRGVKYRSDIDPTALAASTLRPGVDFWETKLEPQVTEANDLMQRYYYAEEYDTAKKIYEENRAVYDEKIKQAKESGNNDRVEYLEYQKRGLTPPGPGKFRPQSPYGGFNAWFNQMKFGEKQRAAGDYLRKVESIFRGYADSYYTSAKYENPVTNDFSGFNYGPSKIEVIELKDDGIVVHLQNGNPVHLYHADSKAFLKMLTSSNPATFGEDGADLDLYTTQYMDRKGATDYHKLWDPKTEIPALEEKAERLRERGREFGIKLRDEFMKDLGVTVEIPGTWKHKKYTRINFMLPEGTILPLVKTTTDMGERYILDERSEQKAAASVFLENYYTDKLARESGSGSIKSPDVLKKQARREAGIKLTGGFSQSELYDLYRDLAYDGNAAAPTVPTNTGRPFELAPGSLN